MMPRAKPSDKVSRPGKGVAFDFGIVPRLILVVLRMKAIAAPRV
jgi:hypothetical protein